MTIKQWAERNEPSAIARVVKRLERFSGNTTDSATQAAASELVEMIQAVLPVGNPNKKKDDSNDD